MKRIDFNQEKGIETEEHTSRGNQPKWFLDGFWYKQDAMGYEAAAEVIASELLQHSDIKEYVSYSPVLITADGLTRAGCSSHNFLCENESLIPINKLHRLYRGQSLAQAVSKKKNAEERISYSVEFVETETGLRHFGRYLAALLEFDSVVLNEDRHFNNIAVIYNSQTDSFRTCPFFDNGLSFLSDLQTYSLDGDPYKMLDMPKAKPFEQDYELQAQICRDLYGPSINLSIRKQDLAKCIDELSEYYREDILLRIQNVVYYQLQRSGIMK